MERMFPSGPSPLPLRRLTRVEYEKLAFPDVQIAVAEILPPIR